MHALATGVRAYIIIALIAALSGVAGWFTMPPLDRDESRFAQATAQMLETGDFVRINFLEEERNKKPVGIHWMQAATVALVSSAEAREIWVYRIPSTLGAILAALAAFWGGQRLVGREAAFAGSALFAATVLLGIEAGIAKTDAMLAGATTLAMAALMQLRAGVAKGRLKDWQVSLVFWFAIGLGALLKGPVTPMVAGLTLIALFSWERRARWMKPLLFWPGPILAILLVLPWLVSIQIATDGNFLREALGDDLGPKVVSGHERHGGLPGYHLLLLPLLFFPATLFLVPGVGRLAKALKPGERLVEADAARFLICWAVPTWVVFELLPTKLPHYVLPAYPALALAAGWGLVELYRLAPWQRWTSLGLYAFAALVFAVALPVLFVMYGSGASWDAVQLVEAGFSNGFQLGLDPAAAAGVFLGTTLLAGLAAGAMISERFVRTAGASLVPALVLTILAGLAWQGAGRGVVVGNTHALQLARQVDNARAYSQPITGLDPTDIVTASSFTEPSLVFLMGSDTHLADEAGPLEFAAQRTEPTLVVLDLSRDADMRRVLLEGSAANPVSSTDRADATQADLELRALLYGLEICHRTLAPGFNYSRGDETVLAILFTRCARPGEGLFEPPVFAMPGSENAVPMETEE
ncbi:ArnT family glycosyltransferase [Maricaulis sp. D1M11]|uniref:ArnT family glycosyltransferase n=1 Tax=Maricaulis sp. D1M11 TaxID=3076117 RepID=UPI0039B4C21A